MLFLAKNWCEGELLHGQKSRDVRTLREGKIRDKFEMDYSRKP
jgi:hypothetical protein